jgi:hypothetical protein
MLTKGVALADNSLISQTIPSVRGLSASGPKLNTPIPTRINIELAGPSIPSTTPFTFSQISITEASLIAKQTDDISRVLNNYPTELLKSSGLKKVVLVKDLNWGGQHQVALPDVYDSGYLIISLDPEYVDGQDGNYINYVVHHELGHFIHTAYNNMSKINSDQDWKSCGSTISQYLDGGLAFNGDNKDAWEIHPSLGFITSYATASIAEDEAEVHAQLQTNPTRLYKLAETDTILACKVKVQVDRLQSLSK